MMRSRRQLLIEALEHLAADAMNQEQYLIQLGLSHGIDELALEFDDIAAARDDMLAAHELALDEHQAIKSIDGALAAMSGEEKSDLWTCTALVTSTRWIDIRERAKNCLNLLKRTQGGGL